MADYGVYLQVTNGLPAPLYFSRLVSAEGNCCTYDGPQSIPNDHAPHQVHLNDPCTGRGAEGTAYFTADVGGVIREYALYGDCPLWSSKNSASGPGVTNYNISGNPLNVTIAVDESTGGWTQVESLVHHVFVLMLENRSFDHMLGFSGLTGTDAETGHPTTINGLTGSESNAFNGTTYSVTKGADWTMPIDPCHEFCDVLEQLAGTGATYPPGGPYPPVDMSGFVSNYARGGGQANPGEIMRCFDPSQLPVLTTVAQEFALCDGWHASMPGPTWPNRFFMMAASAGGLDRSPDNTQMATWEGPAGFTFQHGSLFDRVGSLGWRVYRGDQGPLVGAAPIAGALKGVSVLTNVNDFSKFSQDINGDYPYAFTLIEPNYGDAGNDTYAGGTSQHPMDDVRSGEALIKQVYDALRNSPLWPSSMLIVTWDEHGGFYDHVAPTNAVAPGDTPTTTWPPHDQVNLFGFVFDMYGVRVPAVVISPYVARNVIDHRTYDHSSIPATVERLFGLAALTDRDAAAGDVRSLLTLTTPRDDAPTSLPDPVPIAPGAAPAGRVDGAQPLGQSNLAGFLHVAMKTHLENAPPDEHAAIVARVSAIHTKGEARDYVHDVVGKLNATTGADVVT